MLLYDSGPSTCILFAYSLSFTQSIVISSVGPDDVLDGMAYVCENNYTVFKSVSNHFSAMKAKMETVLTKVFLPKPGTFTMPSQPNKAHTFSMITFTLCAMKF